MPETPSEDRAAPERYFARPRQVSSSDQHEERMKELQPMLEQMKTRNERDLLLESGKRLYGHEEDAVALLKEAELIESHEYDSFRRFEEDFEPEDPFDTVFARYRRMLAREARQGVSQRQFDKERGALWTWSLRGMSHWLDDNFALYHAAELRRRAFLAAGARDYPVLACRRCYLLTGWVTSEPGQPSSSSATSNSSHSGWCDYCLWSEAVVAIGKTAYTVGPWTGRARYYEVGGRYDRALLAEYATLERGVDRAPLFGRARRRRHEQRRVLAWSKVLHDLVSDWGPAEPEEGYELWIAERFDAPAQDESALLVHFWASRYRWDGSRWLRKGDKLERTEVDLPTVFAAALEPAQLAAAWLDFRLLISERNRHDWEKLAAARAAKHEEQATKARWRAELAESAGAAELLES